MADSLATEFQTRRSEIVRPRALNVSTVARALLKLGHAQMVHAAVVSNA